MAFAVINSANFKPYPEGVPAGAFPIIINETIPSGTAAFAAAGDYFNLRQILGGSRIVSHQHWENGDADTHATPTADFDLVVVEDALPGAVGTATILHNTGTLFQAASTTLVSQFVDKKVSDNIDGLAVLALKAVTLAATPAAFVYKAVIWCVR
jgi:hypothetical protein